jgi:DNA-binding transcriptional ArsR family regulator
MAVTFLLPSERPVGVVGFAWSPLLEVALSLRPLVHPKRYPMHLPWARRCRDLPDDLRDEIRLLTSGFQGSLPGVFEVGLRGDLPSFDDELASFAALDEELFLHEWSLAYGGASCSMDAVADRAVVHDPAYAREVAEMARATDPAYGEVVEAAFADPAAMRDRMAAMLRRYWDAAFRDEWDRIQPRLEAEVTDGARALVTTGMPGLVAEFLPEGRWDPDTTTVVVDKHWERTCDVTARGGMLLVPTVYGWPNVLIELAEPWPVAIFFPLRDMRQPEVPHATDHEVADGLRALGDETRLQITRLVAEQPRSTKELAALLSLSESAVSRHLKLLASAGVVTSERDGYFVLYRLVPERIGALGGALRRTLGLAQAATGRVPALPVALARAGRE